MSALLFILVIDRVCKPMVREVVIRQGIEHERRINPLPLQALADDVVVVNYNAKIINVMFDIGKAAIEIAGLEVKPSICAVNGAFDYNELNAQNLPRFTTSSMAKATLSIYSHRGFACAVPKQINCGENILLAQIWIALRNKPKTDNC